MRLLQNELKRGHSVLELVALESFAFNLVNAREDLLEAILKVFNAEAVNFFYLHALVS